MRTNRYPVLRVIAVIYKSLAVIIAVLTVIGACGAPLMGGTLLRGTGFQGAREMGFVGGLITGLVFLINGGIVALFLYAAGEGITLLMDIEANTRLTAELLEHTRS